VEQKKSKLQ